MLGSLQPKKAPNRCSVLCRHLWKTRLPCETRRLCENQLNCHDGFMNIYIMVKVIKLCALNMCSLL